MHIEKAYFLIFISNKIYSNRKTKFKKENNRKGKKKQQTLGHVSKAKVCFMKERKGILDFIRLSDNTVVQRKRKERRHREEFSQSVQFRCSVVSDSLRPCGLQHTRLPSPSPTPGAYSNSCPSHQ